MFFCLDIIVPNFLSIKNFWHYWSSSEKLHKKLTAVALSKATFCQLLTSTLDWNKERAQHNLPKSLESSGIVGGTVPVDRQRVFMTLPSLSKIEQELNESIQRYLKVFGKNQNQWTTEVSETPKFYLLFQAGKNVSVKQVADLRKYWKIRKNTKD